MGAKEEANDIKTVNHTTNPANHTVKTARNLTSAKQANTVSYMLAVSFRGGSGNETHTTYPVQCQCAGSTQSTHTQGEWRMST